VKEETISDAIKEKSATSLQLIQDTTGAACNCGRCVSTIEAFLENYNPKKVDSVQ